eukprot:184619_1
MYNYNNIETGSVATSPSKLKAKSSWFKLTAQNALNRLNVFTSQRSKKHDVKVNTLESVIIVFSVSFLSFWIIAALVMIGAFFCNTPLLHDSSTTLETYQEWLEFEQIDIESVDKDLDSLLAMTKSIYDEKTGYQNHSEVDKQLTNIVYNHCIHELHFGLDEIAVDSIISEFEILLWHLSQNVPISLHEDTHNFVITNHGTIVSANGGMLENLTENIEFGYCSLLQEVFVKLQENDLLEDNHYDTADADTFTSADGMNNEDIWNTKYKHLFLMTNENADAYTLIEESLKTDHHDAQKLKKIHIMTYQLLHKYCANVFEYLDSESEEYKDVYTKHETFIEGITTHLYEIQFAQYGIQNHEVPLVGKDGVLWIGDRNIELDQQHETCPFMQKLIYYESGSIQHQLDHALTKVTKYHNESHQVHHVMRFDAEMDLFFEQHCPDMVFQLETNQMYHIQFRDNFYRLSSDLVHGDSKICKNQKYFVSVTNGDITAVTNTNTVRCSLMDEMVALYGAQCTDSEHNQFYKISDFDLHFHQKTKQQYAEAILEYMASNDLPNLKHIIGEMILEFYDNDIKQYYSDDTDRHQSAIQTLSSSMEQFVLDMFSDGNNKNLTGEHMVVMDVLAGMCMAVTNAELDGSKPLSDHLVRVDVLTSVKDLYYKQQDVTRAETESTNATNTDAEIQAPTQVVDDNKSDYATEAVQSPTVSELQLFVQMLWNDAAKLTDAKKIMNEFDEDIVYGLDTYCKAMMDELTSFGKRKLRSSIALDILSAKKKIVMPIVSKNGDIIPFDKLNDGPQESQFFKCSFVAMLLEQTL